MYNGMNMWFFLCLILYIDLRNFVLTCDVECFHNFVRIKMVIWCGFIHINRKLFNIMLTDSFCSVEYLCFHSNKWNTYRFLWTLIYLHIKRKKILWRQYFVLIFWIGYDILFHNGFHYSLIPTLKFSLSNVLM